MTVRTRLDDLDALGALDSEGVLGSVERLSEQVGAGFEIGLKTPDLPDAIGLESVLVLGMGGSGVSGDVIQAVVEPRLSIHWRTIKGYGPLPEWVGRNTLVIGVSYSGSTEETVAALKEAHDRGARAIVVSSGGPLAEMAESYGLAHASIPGGLQPRASLGYLAVTLLGVLQGLGLIPDATADVDETVSVLAALGERCHRNKGVENNPAKDLAARIHGRVPVIYGGQGIGSCAAYRFKCDLNEYGKTPAFWGEIPELDHNEIVGWNQLGELTKANFMIVQLRDPHEHRRTATRFELTRRLIRPHVAEIVEVGSEGESALARLMSLILVTQLAAIYVGLAYGVDPGPVEVIQKLKAALANG